MAAPIRRSRELGLTLIEVVLAVGVMGVVTVAITKIFSNVGQSARSMEFETGANRTADAVMKRIKTAHANRTISCESDCRAAVAGKPWRNGGFLISACEGFEKPCLTIYKRSATKTDKTFSQNLTVGGMQIGTECEEYPAKLLPKLKAHNITGQSIDLALQELTQIKKSIQLPGSCMKLCGADERPLIKLRTSENVASSAWTTTYFPAEPKSDKLDGAFASIVCLEDLPGDSVKVNLIAFHPKPEAKHRSDEKQRLGTVVRSTVLKIETSKNAIQFIQLKK